MSLIQSIHARQILDSRGNPRKLWMRAWDRLAHDNDISRIGEKVGNLTIEHVDDLERSLKEKGIAIAIIATPATAAQETAERLRETTERLQETTRQLQDTAERLAALSQFAVDTGASLQRCITMSRQLTNDIVAAVNAGTLDAEATNRRIEDVNALCGDAQDEYAELLRRVDALSP